MGMKRLIAGASVFATAIGGAVVGAVPAQAHDSDTVVWTAGNVGRAKGGVRGNHMTIWIRDLVDEGWGARTRYWTEGGGYDIVGDADGQGGNDGVERSYNGRRVLRYQVCVGRNGANSYCSGVIAA
jgi:hypothetical protein